jgi:hypothetical protein
MSSAITDLLEMVEPLPDEIQRQVVAHVREYIADLQDEQRWDESFNRTQSALVAAARRAKQERAAGKARAMNYEEL